VYRLHDKSLEQLTNDHRLWLSQDEHYLSRALGMNDHLELDYLSQGVTEGTTLLLTTDGVHEFVSAAFIVDALHQHAHDLDQAARLIVEQALQAGSPDNLTIQIVRVESLPEAGATEIQHQLERLPLPPLLEAGKLLDGYRIIRALHESSRSHVYLARDEVNNDFVAIKIPSIDLREDKAYLERFLLEDWIARRLNNPHVLKSAAARQPRSCLYLVMEYVEGQSLRQWMFDNPQPAVESVRVMVEQIARGVQAFHRMEMLHQDLRPENIMIDGSGLLRIIDFGAVRVAGLEESVQDPAMSRIHGTVQYTAPEYFLGEAGSACSDLYSLGSIAYEMLSGRLPYGAEVAKTRTRAQQGRLQYRSVLDVNRAIPAWVDFALRKAVEVDPNRRYAELSEFLHDLRRPNSSFLNQTRPPLLERNPAAFWRAVSALLALTVMALLLWR
jgi:serine/threonine protein kinase